MVGTIESFGDETPNRGNITFDGTTSVLYRGTKLYGADIDRMLAYKANGFPEDSMIAFLEAKLRNVSATSVEALYSFLENKGMPITDRGTVLGYKGVSNNYFSINSGSEPLVEGIRDEDGHVRNQIGDVIAMDRRYVCADNNQDCAGGLHVGSKNYATNWAGQGGKVMVVEFSPEFVVSVPVTEHEKLRVSRYKVVGELANDFLGDVYNSDYVRPTDAPNPDSIKPDEEIVTIAASKPMYNISEWSKGQAKGYKDGKAHQKRLFYEEDKGSSFEMYSSEFVAGYLAGYRDGRGL
jgi:hypothetical protein